MKKKKAEWKCKTRGKSKKNKKSVNVHYRINV